MAERNAALVHHHFCHVTSEEVVAYVVVTPSESIDIKAMEDLD